MIPSKKRLQEKIKQYEKDKASQIQISNYGLDKFPEQLIKSKILLNTITTLDLSSNVIASLPDKIVRLTSLTSINLSRNKFITFPEILCSMIQIKHIRVDNNQINHIPDSICNLVKLSKFNISHNNIRALPEQLSKLSYLEQLETTGNHMHPGYLKVVIAKLRQATQLDLTSLELTALPPSLHQLQNTLERLILTANRITEIHTDIFTLTSLRVLEFRNNQITSIPSQISVLQELEVLGFAENLLTSLPDTFDQLKNLTFLNLSENRFTEIPKEIYNLPQLKELFFNKNFPGLGEIPSEFQVLCKSLQTLHMRGNRIESIQIDFSDFICLKSLNLADNPFDNISATKLFDCKSIQDIDITNTGVSLPIQKITQSILISIFELDLSEMKLSNIPKDLFLCKHIKVLYLHKNNLTEIPNEISKLTELKVLTLSNNQISKLPNEIASLPNLEEIDISENIFTCFPEILSKNLNLKIIKMAKNKIETLCNFENKSNIIEEIYCSDNLIKNFDDFIQFSNLKILHCNQNKISIISSSISKLCNIESIFLNENQIEEISEEIGKCTKIKCLFLQDNQISDIPSNLLQIQSVKLDGNYLSPVLSQIINTPNDEKACSIDLSEMNLYYFPNEILFLSNLTKLDLSNNQIKELTINLSPLKHLKEFSLINNQIENLPDWFNELQSLEILILNKNPIIHFPESICNLQSLKKLCMRDCLLESLPNHSVTLSSLQYFDCSTNKLSNINSSFLCCLHQLKIFKCNRNFFSSFPHYLFLLENLEILEANYNQLEYLSDANFDAVIACKSLKIVRLDENCLVDLPLWLFDGISLEELHWNGNSNLPQYYSMLRNHLLAKFFFFFFFQTKKCKIKFRFNFSRFKNCSTYY